MRTYNQSFIDKLVKVGQEYHLDVFLHEQKCKDYVVASIYNIPENIDAQEVARKVKSNPNLFYPLQYAIAIEADNLDYIVNDLLDYGKKSELIRTIYPEHGLDIPDVMTTQEVNALMRFNYSRFNSEYPSDLRIEYGKAIDDFFRDEHKNGFTKRWRLFKRSEKFSNEGSLMTSVKNVKNSKSNEVDINTLLKSSDKLETIGIKEETYQQFKVFLNEYYPDVIYYAHKLDVIDWGNISVPKDSSVKNPFENQQRHFESRQITFKESDSELVYKVLNSIAMDHIKIPMNNLQTILSRGKCEVRNIPRDDLMNVVSLSEANNLIIHIDKNGDFSTPNALNVGVIYNAFDSLVMDKIMSRIFIEKSEFSHVIAPEQKHTLQMQIQQAKNKQLVQGKNPNPIAKEKSLI